MGMYHKNHFVGAKRKRYIKRQTSRGMRRAAKKSCRPEGMKSYIPKEKEEKQLAEWLEELKSYRASVFSGDMTQKMLKEEYCKAVDDLLENANEMCVEVDMGTYTMKAIGIGLLEQIAEQLKVGDGE